MSKTPARSFINKVVSLVAVFALVTAIIPTNFASAAAITNRKVTIGSSALSATTTYDFSFNLPSATVVRSFAAQICDTAAGACTQTTTAAGFSSAGAGTLPSQPTNLGSASGWTSNVASTTQLRVLNAANGTAPTGTSTISFQSVTNPTTTSGTFFLRMTTYSDSAWTTPIDTGTVAASTANQVAVTATVDEALTFSVSGTTAALGTLTTGTTGSNGTLTMTASTNGNSGYSITYTGTALTSTSGGTIPGLTNALNGVASPAAGTAGWGFNLASNTFPTTFGAAPSGTGTGTASASPQYNAANAFRFNSTDVVAGAGAATNSNTYTLSFVANISGATPAGSYSSTISYVATPNF